MPPPSDIAHRVAIRYAMQQDFFKPGDPILFGKFKNRHGILVRVFTDAKGQPMIEIEPVPKGRKKNRVMSLFRIWRDPKPPEQTVDGKLASDDDEDDGGDHDYAD